MSIYEITFRFEAPDDATAFQSAHALDVDIPVLHPGFKLERLSRVLVTHMVTFPAQSEEPGPPEWQEGPQGQGMSDPEVPHVVCEPQWNEATQWFESSCICGRFFRGRTHEFVEELGCTHALHPEEE